MTTQANATVYRELSATMRQGLKDIYQQISTASSEASPDAELQAPATDILFHEASAQLDEVLKATESAAMSIMEIVEKHLELQAESAAILERMRSGGASESQEERLREINDLLGQDLTVLLTDLSFQDITGQRIKKVVAALNQIESRVVELYVSSGLVMEGAEKDPSRDAASLRDEADKAVRNFKNTRKEGTSGQLKGPDAGGCSQDAIDDMLSQLGL
ncbi:MAG: protein phosphatase CheZ [Desulfovibrio sp.]|jgi:chemotaxis protein CheZ|nr:protein phosphatase CheZ [Desulfovibrio sp.]